MRLDELTFVQASQRKLYACITTPTHKLNLYRYHNGNYTIIWHDPTKHPTYVRSWWGVDPIAAQAIIYSIFPPDNPER